MAEAVLQPEYFIMELANCDITKRGEIVRVDLPLTDMVEWKLVEIAKGMPDE